MSKLSNFAVKVPDTVSLDARNTSIFYTSVLSSVLHCSGFDFSCVQT